MMSNPGAELECRVLVFAPIGRDGALTRELLARASIPSVVCASLDQVCTEFSQRAGAIILTEEALEDSSFPALAATVERQPAWSDVPVIVFAGGSDASAPARTLGVIDALRNVTVIERPIRMAAVISVVRAALRARLRQYQMRDTLVALRAARSEAEAASRLKDEFLATLSHELRTPLNAILGWTSMLRHGQVEPARVGQALEVVERNARAQAQLIEDVLDMARIITGKLGVELRPVSLEPIVDAAVEAARPGALAKGIRLQARLRDVPTIRGDAGRLQQVLWNLLSNAMKFTPPGGEVIVSLELRDSHAVLTVSDTGVGVAADFLPFIFDRFRQADQSVTRGHGGLGLGLSIVKHLVELHGGTVCAESAGIAKGTSFRVSLPIPVLIEPPVERRDRELRQGDAFAIRFDGRRILVVDDDPATRELLAEVLGRTGAAVETADSTKMAMMSIGRRLPDLLIADIGMPGEDGYSLIRRLRSLPGPARMIPAMALSAYTRAEDRGAAEEAGFTRFIAKPATPQQLLRAVEALLNSTSDPRQVVIRSGPEQGGSDG
jgi:signal transduction histidine kinase/ActR/RegA family two-component response regulator